MLYLVTLNYLRPIEEVNAHLDTHRVWLAQQTQAGKILVAGPLEDRTGGFVLARSDNRDELDRMLAQDSFVVHQMVEPRVQGFEAALCSPAFPSDWAPGAKVIQ